MRGLRAGLTAALALVVATATAVQAQPAAPAAPKVLRYAFPVAETGFDPAQISDIYSRSITPHIFEGLYQYDPLARPAKARPLTAAGMPEHSADYRTWTVKLKPGIYFSDDPAFGGKPRELVAADYVYSFKRFADPAVKSPAWSWMAQFGFVGLDGLREAALKGKQPFDYDRPIEGLKALDRYTVQFRLEKPSPRFVTSALTLSDLVGAVAREVVEKYGADINAHPVGTGPFVLRQWRRSSLIVLERNPQYRDVRYDAEPAADDAAGQALLARLKGRKLPMLDRVEVSIVEENQPRWLSFLQQRADLIELLPAEFVNQAMPGGKLAPYLAEQGLQAFRSRRSDISLTMFNMEDPIVGGYTPDKVALRRAISLAVDVDAEIRLVLGGQGVPAQSPVMPNTLAYDPAFKSENSDHDPARAKALLDLYGYVDRDGDGWRDMPDGSPLLLRKATQPDQRSRQQDDLWKRNMTAVGLRIEFQPAKWPENLKASRAGKLMMWGVGSMAAGPDSLGTFQRYHGAQIGGQNMSRFKLPALDAIYEQLDVMPDGPERDALFVQARKLAVAYMPYKSHSHRIVTDMAQPWLIGYRRPLFWQDFWQYLDIDTEVQRQRAQP
ncbi:MAG: ABC transporter substrate-binding protein [Aquincola tertiaricarbonis]|uniref:ABC transporter substrate-binding protein n=1 Tax=Aquincola sp. J276 TaxID=2898432 RepID=UPI0021512EE4|nr:ABC transporter substrate-binding protein [Aquincola sp. J276]MCR5865907.1 ABC transporter substrate-binding protein [Aquincola sp. J276]